MPFILGIEVRDSPLQGKGLFATKKIPKGTVFWKYKGDTECHVSLTDNAENHCYTNEELQEIERDDLAKSDTSRTSAILWGGYYHPPSGKFIDLVDGGNFTNHSHNPNVGGEWSDNVDGEFSMTLRDIEPDEEIFDDYSSFQDTTCPWLVQLMKSYCADRHKFEATLETRPAGYFAQAATEMKVTAKKSPGLYVKAAKSMLTDHESLQISGLGNATNTVAAVAVTLEKAGVAKIAKVHTHFPNINGGANCCQLIVILQRA